MGLPERSGRGQHGCENQETSCDKGNVPCQQRSVRSSRCGPAEQTDYGQGGRQGPWSGQTDHKGCQTLWLLKFFYCRTGKREELLIVLEYFV